MARFATVMRSTGEVINIAEMSGTHKPQINERGAEQYDVIPVGPDVKIGMKRGGPLNATEGFGFPADHRVGGAPLASINKIPGNAPDRAMVRADELAKRPVAPKKKDAA